MNDITKHRWQRFHHSRVSIDCNGDIEIDVEGIYSVEIGKDDAIAIANHFGLLNLKWTAELDMESTKKISHEEPFERIPPKSDIRAARNKIFGFKTTKKEFIDPLRYC